jgi:hypothetical protein
VVDVTDDVVKTTVRSKLPTTSTMPRVTAINAIRFPRQSHILPPMTDRPGICNFESLGITSNKGQSWWNTISNMKRMTAPPLQQQPLSKLIIPPKYTNSHINNNGGNRLDSNLHRNEVLDLLQTAIHSSIIPIPLSDTATSRNDGTLWVDRYYNDLGNNNESILRTDTTSDVYNQIHNFIERFMLERQKVERANIEKQNKQRQTFFGLPTTSKPKNKSTTSKRRTFVDDDDDLWDDDE